MNSNIFAKSIVDNIVGTFPNLKCSYEFDTLYYTHYLEIQPKEEFNSNEDLNTFLDDIYFDFISKFPSESIAFSTNSGDSQLESVSYEKCGSNFEAIKVPSWTLIKVHTKFIIKDDLESEEEFFSEDEFSFAA